MAMMSLANPLGTALAGVLARLLPLALIFLLTGVAVVTLTLPLFRFWNMSVQIPTRTPAV